MGTPQAADEKLFEEDDDRFWVGECGWVWVGGCGCGWLFEEGDVRFWVGGWVSVGTG
jgi:hypothetical protein